MQTFLNKTRSTENPKTHLIYHEQVRFFFPPEMQGGLILGDLSCSQSWEKNHVITSTHTNKATDKIQHPVDAGCKPQTTGYRRYAPQDTDDMHPGIFLLLFDSLPKRDEDGVPRWFSRDPPPSPIHGKEGGCQILEQLKRKQKPTGLLRGRRRWFPAQLRATGGQLPSHHSAPSSWESGASDTEDRKHKKPVVRGKMPRHGFSSEFEFVLCLPAPAAIMK